MRKALAIVSLLGVILWGCRTYDEGPVISLRAAKEVIAGNWRIDSYRVDGADSMWVIHGLHLHGNFNFVPYSNYSNPPLRVITLEDTSRYAYQGIWRAYKGECNLLLSSYSVNSNRQTINREMMPLRGIEWKIIRLKNKQDFWLKGAYDGKQYELKFISNQ